MFERYTPHSRRAVYFAAVAAVYDNTREIGSQHLLRGLLHDLDSRVNALFHLQELLPDEAAAAVGLCRVHPLVKDLVLTDDHKRILAYTAMEARRLGDYWIDAEHLVLGILREKICAAAICLNSIDIHLKSARQIVAEVKDSRPDYGPVPTLWKVKRRFLLFFWQ